MACRTQAISLCAPRGGNVFSVSEVLRLMDSVLFLKRVSRLKLQNRGQNELTTTNESIAFCDLINNTLSTFKGNMIH